MNDPLIYEKYFFLEYVLQENYNWQIIERFPVRMECVACYNNLFNQSVYKLPCGHIFDYDCIYKCILQLKMYHCPCCKRPYINNKEYEHKSYECI